jgi:hypothetical protein
MVRQWKKYIKNSFCVVYFTLSHNHLKIKIMNRTLFSIILLLFSLKINAQVNKSTYLKLDNGFSVSSLQSSPDLNILENTNTNYSAMLGVDFAQKKWFYFSSQLGYIRIGGNETNPGLISTPFYKATENSDYVHLRASLKTFIFF